MKKTTRKLGLRKETLVSLSNDRLRHVGGGVDELSRRCLTTVSKSDLCPTKTKDTIPIYSEASCLAASCGCQTVTTTP